MDLRSSKVIGMTWNLRSACRNRWSASLEWARHELIPARVPKEDAICEWPEMPENNNG